MIRIIKNNKIIGKIFKESLKEDSCGFKFARILYKGSLHGFGAEISDFSIVALGQDVSKEEILSFYVSEIKDEDLREKEYFDLITNAFLIFIRKEEIKEWEWDELDVFI